MFLINSCIILEKYKMEQNLQELHMVFDQATCHTTTKVQQQFSHFNIQPNFFPKRMTNLLQPADVCWMGPFKSAYFSLWNNWLINAPKAYTASGNLKSSGYGLAINWISQIFLYNFFSHFKLK